MRPGASPSSALKPNTSNQRCGTTSNQRCADTVSLSPERLFDNKSLDLLREIILHLEFAFGAPLSLVRLPLATLILITIYVSIVFLKDDYEEVLHLQTIHHSYKKRRMILPHLYQLDVII
jgi:hypothetical protein